MDLHRKPDVTIPDGAPPAELLIDDLVVGDGREATAGMQVTVDYVGVSWSTKAEFDASWNRNDTFSFGLGSGGGLHAVADDEVVDHKFGRRGAVGDGDVGLAVKIHGRKLPPDLCVVQIDCGNPPRAGRRTSLRARATALRGGSALVKVRKRDLERLRSKAGRRL